MIRTVRQVRRAAPVGLALTLLAGVAAAGFLTPASALRGTYQNHAATYESARLARAGHHLTTTFDGTAYPAYGQTLDAIQGLAAVKVGQTEAAKSWAYVSAHLQDYVGYAPEKYAGAYAKALLTAMVQRADPTDVGGVDLKAGTASLETSSGRFSDASQYGDFSNTLSQAYAIIGLKRAGVSVDSKALTYLLRAQCPNGGFRLDEFADQCAASRRADPDATSLAVQALLAAPLASRPYAASRALTYLKSKQAASGGLPGAGPTASVNANSTGLAAAAFATGGRTYAATAARTYLRRQEFTCSSPAALRGAVAYDATRLAAGRKAGARPTEQDDFATSQALIGLGAANFATLSNAGATAATPTYSC